MFILKDNLKHDGTYYAKGSEWKGSEAATKELLAKKLIAKASKREVLVADDEVVPAPVKLATAKKGKTKKAS